MNCWDKNKKNKNLAKIFLASGLALVGLMYFFPVKNQIKPQKLILTLDFGDSQKNYQTFLSEEKIVWSLLQQVAAISGTDLKAEENFFVKKIDGKENGDNGKKWSLYINGKKENRSPHEVTVRAPVKIAFRFE